MKNSTTLAAIALIAAAASGHAVAQATDPYAELLSRVYEAPQFIRAIKEACDATHAETRPVELTGADLFPSARAVVYWNEKMKNAYLNPVNLPAPPTYRKVNPADPPIIMRFLISVVRIASVNGCASVDLARL